MLKSEFYKDFIPNTHMLILGSSGSGKSVVLNGIITSLLFTDCKLVMIDLKRVELNQYKKSKKCIKYADDIKSAIDTLNWILKETDRRYQSMKFQGLKKSLEKPIYVCIDEIAELLTVDKKSVLPLLQRIGQISRAANIKMIACSQCLLASVIPTALRINFDSIIGLRTETIRQSNMIIGYPDLAYLPKYGDFIYKTPDLIKPVHYTGIPMIDNQEIKYVIRHTNKNKSYDDIRIPANQAGSSIPIQNNDYPHKTKKRKIIDLLFPKMFCDGEL